MNPPLISVIMPVRNGAAYLPLSLRALRASRFRDFELIVVDDGSTDDTLAALAACPPDRLVRQSPSVGHTAARNLAARAACGEILVFTDANVVFAEDTLDRIARHFESAQTTCLIGVYGAGHPNGDLPSQYKNGWIRASYLAAGQEATWFFTAIGAIRRDAWEQSGGFNPGYQVTCGGGDIEFGLRLGRAGISIRLDKELAVTHLKRYRLSELLANDLRRAFGWTRMALASDVPVDRLAREGLGNVSRAFAMSTLLAGLTVLGLVGGAPLPILRWLLLAACPYALLNAALFRCLAAPLALPARLLLLPLMVADHLAAGLGVAAALLHEGARRAAERWALGPRSLQSSPLPQHVSGLLTKSPRPSMREPHRPHGAR